MSYRAIECENFHENFCFDGCQCVENEPDHNWKDTAYEIQKQDEDEKDFWEGTH